MRFLVLVRSRSRVREEPLYSRGEGWDAHVEEGQCASAGIKRETHRARCQLTHDGLHRRLLPDLLSLVVTSSLPCRGATGCATACATAYATVHANAYAHVHANAHANAYAMLILMPTRMPSGLLAALYVG